MRKTCCPLQRILNSSVLTCVVLMCFAPIASIFNLQPPGNRIPAQILVLFVISFKKPVQKQMPALLALVFVLRFFLFLSVFRSLCSVFGTSLSSLRNACGIKRTTHDVVSGTRGSEQRYAPAGCVLRPECSW